MSHEVFLKGKVSLCCGDGLHFLRDQPADRYDSVVTDPPYALTSTTKRWANTARTESTMPKVAVYARATQGFMGQKWDTGETAFAVEFWAEVLRVLKPGGHVVAFGGTRTYHRLACAIEDAGFEIRDMLSWLYGSGFPKSHNAGDGWGTALKPACEPVCFGRKPLIGTVAANVLEHGTGAINIDGCRVGTDDTRNVKRGGKNDFPNEDDGWTPKSVTVGSECGRWPANVIHDGSEEVIAAFPDDLTSGKPAGIKAGGQGVAFGHFNGGIPVTGFGDSGSAARFFYTSKADADDRLGSKHPTVKPVDLMQWLVRLVTPKGGLVLDPFAGTGTTAEACYREGMRCMLVERETEYQSDIRRRMALVMAGPDERARESVKAKTAGLPLDAGPLFNEAAE